MIYDYIIIGGGISGLYTAYRLLREKNPTLLILEKNPTRWIGGRANNYCFYHTPVVIGAGIVRKNKDHAFIRLLDELHVEKKEFRSTTDRPPDCHVRKTFLDLKRRFRGERVSFEDYAVHALGRQEYDHFLQCTGLTDFTKEDAHETLYNYGFEDNYQDFQAYTISWRDLVCRLIRAVHRNRIRTDTTVVSIVRYRDLFDIVDSRNQHYYSKHVILASTIDTVRHLLPNLKLLNNIRGQSFMRMYGKFSERSIPILERVVPTATIVGFPLYKIIPIDKKNGTYMIAYCDNKGADYLRAFAANTAANRKILTRIIERSLHLPIDVVSLIRIKAFYWNIGTHYYKPLPPSLRTREEFIERIQHPYKNLFVVGEMISTNQGWTEGAIESVDKIFPRLK